MDEAEVQGTYRKVYLEFLDQLILLSALGAVTRRDVGSYVTQGDASSSDACD